jgi:hypothetical protein
LNRILLTAMMVSLMLAISIVSLAVATTDPSNAIQGSMGPTAGKIAKLNSITIVKNGVPYYNGLPPSPFNVNMAVGDWLMIKAKGKYTGPSGTSALLYKTSQSPNGAEYIWNGAKIVNPGKTVTLKADEPIVFNNPGDYGAYVVIKKDQVSLDNYDARTILFHVIA